MPTTPSPVFIGQLVQLPAVSGGNGGVDKHPGIITEIIDDDAPGGGATVNVRPLPNSASLNLGIVEVTFCLYEEEARNLGFSGLLNNVPEGAWPLDYSWA